MAVDIVGQPVLTLYTDHLALNFLWIDCVPSLRPSSEATPSSASEPCGVVTWMSPHCTQAFSRSLHVRDLRRRAVQTPFCNLGAIQRSLFQELSDLLSASPQVFPFRSLPLPAFLLPRRFAQASPPA